MASNSRPQITMYSRLVHPQAITQEPQRNPQSKPHSERLEPKKPLKTLFLNPPEFQNFAGAAASGWPATREIESYWYPVWLTYPAGMIPGSRLLDASPHKVNWQQTVQICKDYEFLILFTSTVGFHSDIKLIRKIKESNPSMKIAFVGPHGHIKPDETLLASDDIDFVTRGEFDHSVVEYAHGKPISEIMGVSYRKDGKVVHNAPP